MKDYYELLEVEPSLSSAEIGELLAKRHKKNRVRINARNATVREEAQTLLALINEAMSHIGPEANRAAYDEQLAAYQKEHALTQPLADVDLYDALGLDAGLAGEQIEQILDAQQAALGQTDTGSNTDNDATDADDATKRKLTLLDLARRTLLDPEKRATYDQELAQKKAYAAARDAAKPVPIQINGTSVEGWTQLEALLDACPVEGFSRLQDGEIEAWVRWSLGRKQKANRVLDIAHRSIRSETPMMEYQELLRLINNNRPLHLYPAGSGPEAIEPVTIHHAWEIPKMADEQWLLFAGHVDYLIDWVAHYAATDLAEQLGRFAENDNGQIWLERLIGTISPEFPTPKMVIDNVSGNQFDLGDVTPNPLSSSTQSFTIRQQGRGYLYGQVQSTAEWLISTETFDGAETRITVKVERGKMEPGAENHAAIIIEPLDGRSESVRIEVTANHKTAGQIVKKTTDTIKGSFKNWFGGKK